MDPVNTGRFISELRREKGLSQKDLAEKLMVTDKAVSRWETGKGFPDTSLLKPLGDALGVSVGELLSGDRLTGSETEIKEKTDRVILDSLKYAKRMLPVVLIAALFAAGAGMAFLPLRLAGVGGAALVAAGAATVAVAVLMIVFGKKLKLPERGYYALGIALTGIALALEIPPLGAVMRFSAGPGKTVCSTYSYFAPLPLGYADFAPMLTGILTVVVILIGAVALVRFGKSGKLRNAAFVCSVCAVPISLSPMIFRSLNAVSYTVSLLLFLSACVQAVANRRR